MNAERRSTTYTLDRIDFGEGISGPKELYWERDESSIRSLIENMEGSGAVNYEGKDREIKWIIYKPNTHTDIFREMKRRPYSMPKDGWPESFEKEIIIKNRKPLFQ